MPQDLDVDLFKPALLNLPQCRTDLDQMQNGRLAETIHDFRGPQGVVHQRAAPGAKFDEPDILRRVHLTPDGCHPQADQFAEHLADLGRGDEVAAGTQRIAIDVVAVLRMCQAEPHIFAKRHRSGDGN